MPDLAPPPPQLDTEFRFTRKSESDDGGEHDPQFKPVVTLPLVTVPTFEEDELEMCKIRARLYRFDKNDHEWKERGTGDIKLMHHVQNNTVRVVMRRDKTLKICANHFITEELQLNNHIGSDRAFNWTTPGDFADETAKQEFLAVRFGNVDNANLWKTKFLEAIDIVKTKSSLDNTGTSNDDSDDVSVSSSDISTLSEKVLDEAVEPENTTETEKDGFILQLSELKLDKEPAVTVE